MADLKVALDPHTIVMKAAEDAIGLVKKVSESIAKDLGDAARGLEALPKTTTDLIVQSQYAWVTEVDIQHDERIGGQAGDPTLSMGYSRATI